jgi:hypothetical protein
MAPCRLSSPTTPTRQHCRSIGLSGMRGHSHVPFVGEEAMVTPPPYPTVCSSLAPAFGSGSGRALATLSATMRYDEAELAFDTLSSEMF